MIALIPLFTYLTIVAQKRIAALGNTTAFPLGQRFANAIFSYSRYIYQFFFPLKLTAFYPHLKDNYSNLMLAINIIFLTGIFVSTLFLWKKQKIYLIGLIWFFMNLFPVIGIVQVGSQGSADRYMYIPMIGLILILVFGAFEVFEKIKIGSRYAVYLLVLFALLLGIKTFRQSEVWLNSDNLFANMIKDSPNPAQGYINLGLIYKAKENYWMEAEYSRKAIEADSKSDSAYNNLGDALLKLGDIEKAKESFEKANSLNPDHPVTIGNLGYCEELLGNIQKAKELYKRALEINKYYRIVRIKYIYLLEKEQNLKEAIRQCEIGDKLAPDEPDFLRLKCAYLLTPDSYEEARKVALEGMKRFPEEKQFLLAYAEASLNLGLLDEAEKALYQITDSPINNGIVYERIAEIKLKQNKLNEAKENMEKAIKIDPSNNYFVQKMHLILQMMEKENGSKNQQN
jgi:tetratricopeptide (TPR) repeat protein